MQGLENLATDFCRCCGDEEEDETILHLLCTRPAHGWRRKRLLAADCMDDLDEPIMHGHWQSELLHRKFQVVPIIGENVTSQWALSAA